MTDKSSCTADRLKEVMRERNLKQVDILNLCKPVADNLGTSIKKSELSQYLSGSYSPGNKKLHVLALALHVDEIWLMGYDVPKVHHHDESLSREQLFKQTSEKLLSAYLQSDDNVKTGINTLLGIELTREEYYVLSIGLKDYYIESSEEEDK